MHKILETYLHHLQEDSYNNSPFGTNTKWLTTEIKNEFVVIQYHKENVHFARLKQTSINIAIPHNIIDTYKFEESLDNTLITPVKWRWLHTRGFKLNESIGGFFESTPKEIAFESLDDERDFSSKDVVLKDTKEMKRQGYEFIDEKVVKVPLVKLVTAYSDSPDKFDRGLRIMEYHLIGVTNSKWLKPKVIFKARKLIHDYTEYLVPRDHFKKSFPKSYKED